MARRSRSRSRDLAGLAALGALSYSIFGPEGRRRKDGSLASVEDRGRAATPGGSSVAPAATQVRQQPSDLQGMFEGLGPLADTGGVGRSEVAAADQTGMPPPVVAAPAPAATYRPRPAFVAGNSQRDANAAADAMFENRAPATAPRRRSSYDEESVFNPGQDIGPNISVDVSRRTGVPFDNPAGAGRSSGVGGATAEDIEREQEFNRMVRKANALAASGIPYGAQTDASALTYHRSKTRPSTIKGGRGTATGMKAGDIEAYRRQQEELAKRGRGFNTPRRKEGGAIKVKKMASGGMSSASKRGDGIATKGKTKCKMY